MPQCAVSGQAYVGSRGAQAFAYLVWAQQLLVDHLAPAQQSPAAEEAAHHAAGAQADAAPAASNYILLKVDCRVPYRWFMTKQWHYAP